jgi:hypothetical protein
MITPKPPKYKAPMNAKLAESAGGISNSARVLLRRVFRILRGCGISENELRQMAAAAIDEVSNIPEAQPSRVTARQAIMCCDVVLKWRRDCKFLDANGLPAQLAMDTGLLSFSELVRASAPEADPYVLLATMEELGVVRIVDDERIELISESVVACSGQDGLAIASEFVLEHICGFLGSVEFNVFDKPSRAKGRFERACYASVPKELIPVLQQLVNSRGQDFVDVIDEWLARRAVRPSIEQETLLVGAGAYLFVREDFA